MRRNPSPFSIAGTLIFVVYIVVNRFIVPLPDAVAISVLVVGIALAVMGLFSKRRR